MNEFSETRQQRPWFREPLVWLIIALPLAAVIAGISTVVIATSTSDSLVVDGFQKIGLMARRESAEDRRAQAMQLVATVSIDRESGVVTARLDSAESGNTAAQDISLQLHHPTRRELDRQARLQRDTTGLFRGNIGKAASGRWYIQLEGIDNSDIAWRLSGRLTEGQNLITLGSGA